MHWVCLGKNRDLLDKIFGVKRPARWRYAELFSGDIDGLRFRITMSRWGRRRFSFQFGACQTPSAQGKNLVLGLNISEPQWPRFVAKVLGPKREGNPLVFGKSGGLASSDAVNSYIRDAVKVAEARRRLFFEELAKDGTLQGPILS